MKTEGALCSCRIVPKLAVATMARLIYGENYVCFADEAPHLHRWIEKDG